MRTAFLGFLLLLCSFSVLAAPVLIATRVWPAQEYTRVTFEAAQPIKSQVITLKNPERLVLDLEGVDLNGELTDLAARVRADDPYIKQVRVARNKPTVVRVVLDLKTEVKATLFALPPIGEYKHRLVLDIYPLRPVDPLLALLSAGDIKEQAAPIPPERAMSDLLPKPDIEPRDAPRTELKLAMKVDVLKTEGPVDKPEPKAMDKAKKPAADMVRMITVAVDAGHGGEDPGARGRRGTNEKDVTLSIARRLKAKIDAEPNMRAILIRDGDYFIPLQDRVTKAQNVRADLFVSVHADAFPKSQVQGSSVFALSERGATSAAARWLARRENEADSIGGVNLAIKDPYLVQTLLDLSQTATIRDSLKLGKAVLGELGGINRLHKAGVEQAGFAVLKAPEIPSILVETAFISNPEEEKKLKDADYQDQLASAIAAGVKQYFARNPPLARTRLALQDR